MIYGNPLTVNKSVFVTLSSTDFFEEYAKGTLSILNDETWGISNINECFCYAVSSLTNVSFPSASSIGSYAFCKCSNLSTINLLSTSVCTLINSNAFFATPIQYSSYTGSYGSIFVPESLVSDYKVASGWSYYSDRITAYISGGE